MKTRIVLLAVAAWWLVPLLFAGPASLAAASTANTDYRGLPSGFTADGHPYLGALDAPVILEEWSDYGCPYCARHFTQTLPLLVDKYVRLGQVQLVFRDLPLESLHPTAPAVHAAARCAGHQGAAAFWALHDALFERQAKWTRESDPTAFLTGLLEELGLDVGMLRRCLDGGSEQQKVAASVEEATRLGFSGTPQFRFRVRSGELANQPHDMAGAQPRTRFEAAIDALLAGKAPPAEPKPAPREPAELPLWARPEGLAPDPHRPGYTTAGNAYRGNPQARVVVVEFSDFQCPACARHALESQPKIDAALVDTGQVLWVSRHLPLRAHPRAPLAAVAAECAGDQGRFWEMRRRLFETVEQWAVEGADASFFALSGELNLDHDRFAACFNSRAALERVMRDMYDAQGLIQRTPTFVVLTGEPTGTLMGASSAEQFIATLKNRLEGLGNGKGAAH